MVGHFERKLQTEVLMLVIALSCGIKISAMHCLVLSRSTRATDGQTDRHIIPR